MKRLYVWLCKRFRKDGLTFSASAWKKALETGDHSTRIRIDGAFMLWNLQQGHCQQQFQRETREPLQ